MEKRTLIALCAALALTGPVQAASVINAGTRLLLTGAGIYGGGLYSLRHFDKEIETATRAKLAWNGANSTPAATPIPNNTQLAGLEKLVIANQTAQIQQNQALQTQIASMSHANQQPSTITQIVINWASNPLVIGAVLISGVIVYKRFNGTRYTQFLIRKAEEKAKHFREWTSNQFGKIWNRLRGIEDKVDTNAEGLSLIASALATLNNGNIDKDKGNALAQFVQKNKQSAPGQAEGTKQQEKENFSPYVEPAEPEPEQDENSFSVSGATATCMDATASALSWGASWFK